MVPEIEIQDIAKYTNGINVYDSGVCIPCEKDGARFKEICAAWTGMMKFARQMPAFGVSLNSETSKAVKKDVWVEFTFPQTYCNDGMPFERLLVNVVPEFTGFNVIRFSDQYGYDGRCFYFDLIDSDMTDLYEVLKK